LILITFLRYYKKTNTAYHEFIITDNNSFILWELTKIILSECDAAFDEKRFMGFCYIVRNRSDDKDRIVGSILVNNVKEIIGIGWNGLPTKTKYGDYNQNDDKVGFDGKIKGSLYDTF